MRATRGLPVYVFDEHNEAFYFWHEAKKRGLIDRPLDLLHVDAHDDMGRVERFRDSLYFPGDSTDEEYLAYYRAFMEKELDIGSFIVPAVLSGIVRDAYFVYPSWRKMKPRRRRMNVSSVLGEGKVLKYDLVLGSDVDPRVRAAYPDLTRFRYSMVPLEKVPRGRDVILDIDLDFFACRDTVRNTYAYELEVSAEQFEARDAFLADASLPYSGLEFSFAEWDGRFYAQIGHKKVRDVSHLPSVDDAGTEIDVLIDTLIEKRVRPHVVTVSRSCISGYCPPEYVETLESQLVLGLSRLLEEGRRRVSAGRR